MIVKLIKSSDGKPVQSIADVFDIGKSAVSNILRQKEALLSEFNEAKNVDRKQLVGLSTFFFEQFLAKAARKPKTR